MGFGTGEWPSNNKEVAIDVREMDLNGFSLRLALMLLNSISPSLPISHPLIFVFGFVLLFILNRSPR